MTDIANLPSIISEGAVLSRVQLEARNLAHKDAAHSNIIEQRRRKTVPTTGGGNLLSYVPFYFNPKSPCYMQ